MNRSRRILCLAAALAVAFSLGARAAQAKDPLEGTWLLNVEKSSFKVAPGPKGQTRTYSMSSDGVEKLTARGISWDKKPTLVRYAARYDGKDYDITGSLGGDKISLRRIDAHTTQSTQKREGKPAIVATRTVSNDGKTLTVVSKGTTAEGVEIDSTLIFERH
jgi:hypothetical protein